MLNSTPEQVRRISKEQVKEYYSRCVGGNPDAPIAARPPEESIYELPLRSKPDKPKAYPVTRKIFDCWRDAYQLVDCPAELSRIKAWLESNAARRPARDMPRFVNTWLARAQDNAVTKASRSPPFKTTNPTELNRQNFDKVRQIIRQRGAPAHEAKNAIFG